MSYANGPRIVTDGLVLHLDAANRKSYVGSGTTWTDLSGNGNNGTLTNGPTFSSSNGGFFIFDGTDDQVQGAIPSSTFDSSHSISCWLYRESVKQWSALFSNNVTSNSCSILTFINTTNSIGTNNVGINASAISVDLGSDHLNKWIYATIVYNGISSGSTVNIYAYKDNSLISGSGSLYWTLNKSSYYYIGRHYSSGLYYDGFISNISVYNKALSANEVQQNYNALKGRYGL